MKVLMITGALPPIQDGVGDYTAKLAEAMPKDVDLYLLTSKAAPENGRTSSVVSNWGWRDLHKITRVIRRQRPALIHLQYHTRPYGRHIFVNLLPLILRVRFPRTPVAVTIHEYADASILGKLRAAFTAAFANKIITVNKENAAGIHKILARRAAVIGIGSNIPVASLNQRRRDELVNQYGIKPGRTGIYFGFIDPSKGVWSLVDSLKDWPMDSRLLLVTAYDPTDEYHRELKQHIEMSPIGTNITWTGFLPDSEVSELLQIADICVLPFDAPATLRRGSMIAALIHSTPVITTGPVSPPLIDGGNLLALRDNHPTSIAEAASRLLSDEPLRKILRVSAADLAGRFDWSSIAEQHTETYRQLVHKD